MATASIWSACGELRNKSLLGGLRSGPQISIPAQTPGSLSPSHRGEGDGEHGRDQGQEDLKRRALLHVGVFVALDSSSPPRRRPARAFRTSRSTSQAWAGEQMRTVISILSILIDNNIVITSPALAPSFFDAYSSFPLPSAGLPGGAVQPIGPQQVRHVRAVRLRAGAHLHAKQAEKGRHMSTLDTRALGLAWVWVRTGRRVDPAARAQRQEGRDGGEHHGDALRDAVDHVGSRGEEFPVEILSGAPPGQITETSATVPRFETVHESFYTLYRLYTVYI